MGSIVDKRRGEFVDEGTTDRGSGAETPGRSLYGEGVPTAESYVDDMPLEWSRDETGADPDATRDPAT